MTLIETTIDLEDGIGEVQEELDEVRQAQDELKTVLQQEYDSYYDVPDVVQQKWDELQEHEKNLIGQINVLKRVTGDGEHSWGGTELVIGELSGNQLARIQDGVNTGATKAGMRGQDLNGARVMEMLRESVKQKPANAPQDPGDWPWLLMLWVFDKVNNFNTVGETDFQETSLREAMESSR